MRRVHILCADASENERAILFPLRVHRRRLRDAGLDLRLYRSDEPTLGEADLVIATSGRYRSYWSDRADEVLAELERLRGRGAEKIVWFDTTDSTALTQSRVLPAVDAYWKCQALRDRSAYERNHSGGRVFTEFLGRLYGVADDSPPFPSTAARLEDLGKIIIAWNTGLSAYGPWASIWKHAVRLGVVPGCWTAGRMSRSRGEARRAIDVSCRVGLSTLRATIRAHRQAVRERMADRGAPTARLPRRAYFREIERARIVVSPFGFGEVCYRDFETFLLGALLLKPSMEHLETWPDFYVEGETYVAHRWDLGDLDEAIECLLADRDRLDRIRRTGSERYRRALSREGGDAFCFRLRKAIEALATT